jgi:ferric-dicitrate binding protein FerR (iron transport regulator)
VNEFWHESIQRHLSDLQSGPEWQEFQDRLKSDPAFRRLYLDYVNLDVALGSTAIVHAFAESSPVYPALLPASPVRAFSAVRRPWPRFAAAACAMFALACLWLSVARQAPRATLLTTRGAVEFVSGKASRTAIEGEVFGPGDGLRIRDEGRATLSVEGLGRVALGPEADLRLSTEARTLELAAGFIEIKALKQPRDKPWRVRTPEAEAAVIGTRFTVSAADKHTNVRVSEGLVRLTSLASGRVASVAGGNRARITSGNAPEVEASRTGSVLLLTSRHALNADWDRFNQLISDQFVRTRLWRLGFRVDTLHFDEVDTQSLRDRALVIVSLFAEGVGEPALERIALARATVPVVCLEPAGYPVLSMVEGSSRDGYGFGTGASEVSVSPGSHPLVEKIEVRPHQWFRRIEGWGRPSASVEVLASIREHPERAVWFAYEAGRTLPGGTLRAPARRIGLFLDPHNVTDHSSPIWEVFEASVNWSVSTQPPP